MKKKKRGREKEKNRVKKSLLIRKKIVSPSTSAVRANARWIINLNNYLRTFGINRFNARPIPYGTIKK